MMGWFKRNKSEAPPEPVKYEPAKNEYYAIAFTVVSFKDDNSVDEIWTNIFARWCHDSEAAQEAGRSEAKIAFPTDNYQVHAVSVIMLKKRGW